MAETFSTFELQIGDLAPIFKLPDADGNRHALSEIKGAKGTLVVFACNHCPYVIHLAKQLGEMAKEYFSQGISTVVINSNDLENYPQDGPELMKTFALESGWDFPYLLDKCQGIAKSYGAACTPDFFLFDEDLKLAYAGQFDDTRPNSGTADGCDLRNAMDTVLNGEIPKNGKPASGCNIKWKPGNEPS